MNYHYIVKCKEYDKAGRELKKSIDKGMERLLALIKGKEESGEMFEKIFNNETIKYDVLSERFFTFKAHGSDSTQLRLLYEFKREGNDTYIVLHKFFEKRRTNNKYITIFKEYVKNYQ